MLLLAYVLSGWRRQAGKHLFGGCLIAALFQPTWRFILPALGINVADAESAYLTQSLHISRTWHCKTGRERSSRSPHGWGWSR